MPVFYYIDTLFAYLLDWCDHCNAIPAPLMFGQSSGYDQLTSATSIGHAFGFTKNCWYMKGCFLFLMIWRFAFTKNVHIRAFVASLNHKWASTMRHFFLWSQNNDVKLFLRSNVSHHAVWFRIVINNKYITSTHAFILWDELISENVCTCLHLIKSFNHVWIMDDPIYQWIISRFALLQLGLFSSRNAPMDSLYTARLRLSRTSRPVQMIEWN